MYDFIDLHDMHQKVCKRTAQTFFLYSAKGHTMKINFGYETQKK